MFIFFYILTQFESVKIKKSIFTKFFLGLRQVRVRVRHGQGLRALLQDQGRQRVHAPVHGARLTQPGLLRGPRQRRERRPQRGRQGRQLDFPCGDHVRQCRVAQAPSGAVSGREDAQPECERGDCSACGVPQRQHFDGEADHDQAHGHKCQLGLVLAAEG